eukprot:COSAG01_NODE_67890_length_265_cov_1.867470_1_plen_27_part_10
MCSFRPEDPGQLASRNSTANSNIVAVS